MNETLLLVIAALIVGLSKGGLASAAAIAVPMLALFMSPVKAAATLLPVYIVTDWIGVWLYRHNYSKRNLAILTPSIVLGVGIATLITPYTPESVLLLFTGAIGLWYCLRTWFARGSGEKAEPRVAPGVFWGATTGHRQFHHPQRSAARAGLPVAAAASEAAVRRDHRHLLRRGQSGETARLLRHRPA